MLAITKFGPAIRRNRWARNRILIMSEAARIRVVWICSVSNPDLRNHLELYIPKWQKILRYIVKKPLDETVGDSAVWNTNALREFEKIEEVDLHVIFVHPLMHRKIQRFEEKGIHYYAVSEGDDSIISFIRKRCIKGSLPYEKTWKRIVQLVKEIEPEIVHMIGAENPPYSWSLMKLPKDIPTFVQLQTLTHNPAVLQAYSNVHPEYELPVIKRADYIGTKSTVFPEMIRQFIKKDPICVNTALLVAEEPDLEFCEKVFDFVYFANYISKAIDLAVEAFAIAHSHQPSLTLDIIGGASEEEFYALKTRIRELGINNAVTIEGRLATHEDVITQIKKSKFALLPLKSDIVSGTIREAISVGLPVVTSITQGTPSLNEKRESVLLSQIGDNETMANNMLRLVNDKQLEEELRRNALITLKEKYGTNADRAQEWVKAYDACILNARNNTPIPDFILNKN